MIEDSRLIRLKKGDAVKPFDCGDVDLNDFFVNDSLPHLDVLLSVTYTIETDSETVAFFSLLNDKISIVEFGDENKKKLKKLIKLTFPRRKRFSSVPAIKIGRLGVDLKFQQTGIGTQILDYIKELFITNNRTGCRFITVDAYHQSIEFYKKNGFQFIKPNERDSDTHLMFYDLKPINNYDETK